MTVDGIASVQARMAELRALVAPPRPAATTSTGSTASSASTGTAATAAASEDFATMLASLTGTSAVPGTAAPGTAASGTPTATGGATAQSFVAAAQKYVGVPYVWGGESLDEGGLDCSGLVIRALADVGVTDFPRVARDQQKRGEPVASLAQALPGDLVVFGGGTHIGIYMGDGKMVDAPKPGAHVVVRDVYTTPTAIRRILPQEQPATVSASVPGLPGGTGLAGLSGLQGLSGLGSLTGLPGLTGPTGLGGTATGTSATAASQRAALELLASLSSTRGSSLAGLATSLGVAS
ncbi:C40 family peptidase [Cellulomonas fimi]|uniref:C40 family peptidase n=1 Tax=Cellulomonas fimi TaxID=1708 RepID=UPI00234D749A|nr:C40 family peptidase [Cellulomonas fimi]MDC7123520.1 C40 family peptidase [Cellulomonas fimi]